MRTIQLSNLDPDGEDINCILSGDVIKINWGGTLHRYRLSRMDATRLLMFVEDLNRRYAAADRHNTYTDCQDHTGKEFDHIERNPK